MSLRCNALKYMLCIALLEGFAGGAAPGILCAVPPKTARPSECLFACPRKGLLHIYPSKHGRYLTLVFVRKTRTYPNQFLNFTDYMFMTLLLLIITATLSIDWMQKIGFRNFSLIILKVVLISNLSKFFLLPILVWRNNTTVFGRNLHHLLVMGHHLCSLVLAYQAVGATRKNLRWWALTLVVIAFAFKETARQFVSLVVEDN